MLVVVGSSLITVTGVTLILVVVGSSLITITGVTYQY
jgi:hypothetical protein